MATLTVETIARTGLNPTFSAAAAGGDEFANDGTVFITVVSGGTAVVVTIVTPNTVDGLAIADRTVTVPSGERRHIGPFPTADYNDSNGKVQLTYDQVSTITIGVFAYIAGA